MSKWIKKGYVAPRGVCDECGSDQCLPVVVVDGEWQLGGWHCMVCDTYIEDGSDHVNDFPFREDIEDWSVITEDDWWAAGWYVA